MKDYEYLLANYCMPTLLKIKPSSLVRLDKKNTGWNEMIVGIEEEVRRYSCCSIRLYENTEMLSVLIYQEVSLKRLLDRKKNIEFLKHYGYQLDQDRIKLMLGHLQKRLTEYYNDMRAEFPHEIGLILGYPRKDVEDFIRYQGKYYLICGCWKVYHHAKKAIRIFERYQSARRYAIRLLQEGKELTEIMEIITD